eukprot:703890-Rhodomonas_salina.1
MSCQDTLDASIGGHPITLCQYRTCLMVLHADKTIPYVSTGDGIWVRSRTGPYGESVPAIAYDFVGGGCNTVWQYRRWGMVW